MYSGSEQGEGESYGGAFLRFITLANGFFILVIGVIRWILILVKK
ncbi:hypothetical protein ACFVT8_06290 [Lysinibacillus sp. NPDC058147]